MSDKNNNNIPDTLEFHIRINRKALSTQLSLGGALLLIYFLSSNSAVDTVVLFIVGLDLLSVIFSIFSKDKSVDTSNVEEVKTEEANTHAVEKSKVRTKPKPLEEIKPEKPVNDIKVESVSQTDNEWAEFFDTH